MLVESKTRQTDASVKDFLDRVKNLQRREDAYTVLKMMQEVTHKRPRMWGPSIVGFDKYHYQYASGHEGEICMIGFSPRSQALVLYIWAGFEGHDDLLRRLGKHTRSKACLYIRKLTDVDLEILETIIERSYQYAKNRSRR
jgi:hypothetical protein